MKLQAQNSIYIVPIFLVLAIAISAIVGIQERDKTLWGLQEEASCLAIGIAEFIGAEGLQTLRQAPPEDASVEELLRPIRRILQWDRAKRVTARAREIPTPLFDLGSWVGEPTGSSTSAVVKSSPAADIRVLKRSSGGTVIEATAPVTASDGKVLGEISVETDASILDGLREAWLRDSAIRVLVALAISLACSGILSWVLRSRIRHLGRALEAAAAGDYTAELNTKSGIIRETSDLASTLSTMVSIIRGTVSRMRRHLLGVERFRTDEDIAEAMDANCWRSKEKSRDGLTIVIRRVGRLPPGTFFDLIHADARACVLFGRVQADGMLNAALCASAALSFLRQLLERRRAPELASEAAELFGLEELTVLEWTGSGQQLSALRFDRGAGGIDSQVTVETRPFWKVFHSLGEDAETRIRLYLEAFPSQPAGELADKLMTLISAMQPMPTGVLTVVFAD